MSWTSLGVVTAMLLAFVVIMNKFSPKVGGGESKPGKKWLIAVVVIVACLYYLSK